MRALLVLALVAPAAAAADTVTGVDETHARVTVSALGSNHAIAQDDTIAWHATGDRVTIDRADHHDLQDGRPADDRFTDDDAQIAKSRAFEPALVKVIEAQSFTADVPLAIPADQLIALRDLQGAISATKAVVTWTGTAGGVAHYRAYVIFALSSVGLTGQVTIAGTFDLDTARHAVVDARMSAVLATFGLAHVAGTASAHLTRSYR